MLNSGCSLFCPHGIKIFVLFGVENESVPRFPHYIVTTLNNDKDYIMTCHYMVLSLKSAFCTPYSDM